MSAEILRRAAALMRGNAEGAQHFASPWFVTSTSAGEAGVGYTTDHPKAGHLATLADYASASTAPEHIASWHPAVAFGVAEWLDSVANRRANAGRYPSQAVKDADWKHALAVARAYLGES